jgi:hypothetical protein
VWVQFQHSLVVGRTHRDEPEVLIVFSGVPSVGPMIGEAWVGCQLGCSGTTGGLQSLEACPSRDRGQSH